MRPWSGAAGFLLAWLARVVPKDGRLVLFGSYVGKRYGDNSAYLFEYCGRHRPQMRCVWMTDNPAVVRQVRAQGMEAELKRSGRGLWLALRSRLIVTSYGTRDCLPFVPRYGYPREWHLSHGSAFRKVLLQEEGGAMKDPSMMRRQALVVSALGVISPLNGQAQCRNIPVPPARMRVTGFPRNDLFFADRREAREALRRRFALPRRVGLYAPHWRKWAAVRFFPFPDLDLAGLASFLRSREAALILRPHMVDLRRRDQKDFWDRAAEFRDVLKPLTVEEYTDVQHLMDLADVLITDYSSIHLDYLLLDRPIIYLPYDLDEFVRRTGGFHWDYEQAAPGPKPRTQEAFLRVLDDLFRGRDEWREARRRLCAVQHTYREGESCRRAAEVLEELRRA